MTGGVNGSLLSGEIITYSYRVETVWKIIYLGMGAVIIMTVLNYGPSEREYVYIPADKTSVDSAMAPAPVVVVSPPDEKALREIIRTVLQQELAPYSHPSNATGDVAPKSALPNTPSTKENSPENVQAFTTVTGVVSGALAQGKWTPTDLAAISPYTHQLTLEQRLNLINEVANAVNRQELELETSFPLF